MKISIKLRLLIILCFSLSLKAQKLEGDWKVDNLIIDSITQSYTLRPLNKDVRYDYGNHLVISDSTVFYSYYTAPCGLDCFTSSHGKYVLTDKDHIQFTIESVAFMKTCSERTSPYTFPLNIGLYYIHRKNELIYLIRSNGDIVQDKLNVRYFESIDSNYSESKQFGNLLKWKQTDGMMEFEPERILELSLPGIHSNAYKILYTKIVDYNYHVILFEYKNTFQYVFCRTKRMDSSLRIYVHDIALYDKQFVNQVAAMVDEITMHKRRYKVKTLHDKNGHYPFATKVYRRKKALQLISVEMETSHGVSYTDYYFNHDSLVYIKTRKDVISGESHFVSAVAYYVTGKYSYISKVSQTTYTEFYNYHYLLKELDKIKQKLKQ